MKMSRLVLAFAAVSTLGLVGCNKDQKTTSDASKPAAARVQTTAGAPVNKTCPVSGEAVPANATTVSYQGKTVGFCCDHCVDKWNKMSDAEKSAKIANASK